MSKSAIVPGPGKPPGSSRAVWLGTQVDTLARDKSDTAADVIDIIGR